MDTEKVPLGVPDNPVAFACKLSFAKRPGSYVFFDSKTKLLALYQKRWARLAALDALGH